MIQVEDWFDIYNPEHLRAYRHLSRNGMWPEGFIPKDVECGRYWQVALPQLFITGFFAEYEKKYPGVIANK